MSFLTLFARFRNHAMLFGSYQDDFFYYLKVAENIASTGISTFDGVHLTNGYHPLWMAVLVMLRLLFKGNSFFVALQAISFAAVVISYVLLLRILRLSLPERLARAGAFVFGMEALMLIRYGMEVTLTIPLALLLVWMLLRDGVPQSFRRAAWLGLIASLMILSRLDSAILCALLLLAVYTHERSVRTRRLAAAGFFYGVLPLLLFYFAANLHYFHLLTPVSGLAKQTKPGYLPSAPAWKSLLPRDRMRAIVLLPELILLFTGLWVAARHILSRTVRWQSSVLLAVLFFPLIHLIILCSLSDWQVWPWYFYSITLAAASGYVCVAHKYLGRWTILLTSAYSCVLVLYAMVYAIQGPNSLAIFQSSQQVATYMDAHPGIYLMGDQAGTTAYLSHQPVVQAEGLVMDKEFLMRMRRGEPLRDVAAAYHAAYYTVIGTPEKGGCYFFAEPSNSGPSSPKMRGTICRDPLATFYRQADHAPIRIFKSEWMR